MSIHTDRIDSLIPIATQRADLVAGAEPSVKDIHAHAAWSAAWNQVFHAVMDQLASAAGIRRLVQQSSFLWRKL